MPFSIRIQCRFTSAPIIYILQDNPRYLEMADEKHLGVAYNISNK